MVVIELVRQFIRPITLRVRLRANLTAGHLILSLLARGGNVSSFFGQLPLYLLELLVCVVQPFVFVLLIFLY
jgi:F-type H+-transporting ATPase subunit a